MNRRERVTAALRCQAVDKIPKDLGSMRSTGVSAFAYKGLRHALGLPEKLSRVFDQMQMLALPDIDLLDALDCDVVLLELDGTYNGCDDKLWKPYNFGGRLPSRVRDPQSYTLGEDGTVIWENESVVWRMPQEAHFFDQEHGGEPFSLTGEIEIPKITQLRSQLEKRRLHDRQVKVVAEAVQRIRSETDRAINLGAYRGQLGFPGGMTNWSVICMLYPEVAEEYFDLVAEYAIEDYNLLLSELAGHIDVITVSADDQGTQESSIISPELFDRIYVPAYSRINKAIHTADSDVHTFLHSCGAIFDLLGSVARAGFDILNPVQWNAGKHSYSEWKQQAVNHGLVLWGGGVDTQHTLPFGTLSQIGKEVELVSSCLSEHSGWVFCPIHNIMADITPEKIICMYKSMGIHGET